MAHQPKEELNAAIILKADTATLNEKVEALEKAIADAEAASKKYADDQDAALKAELDAAIEDVTNGYTAAVKAAKEKGIADSVLFGDAEKIEALAKEIGMDMADYKVVDIKDPIERGNTMNLREKGAWSLSQGSKRTNPKLR